MINKAYLTAISYFLPETTLNNSDIASLYSNWTSESILSKIGISNRHIVSTNQTTNDLAIEAINNLFKDNDQLNKDEVDFLIFCTQSPEFNIPTNACYLQHATSLPTKIGAFDFNLGCSGFVFGLGIAKGLIVSGQAKNVLLVTSETYSKRIHPLDYKNRSIFSDGASACIISAYPNDKFAGEIGNFNYGTIGAGYKKLIDMSTGFSYPEKLTKHHVDNPDFTEFGCTNLYMDGSAIFDFTLNEIPKFIEETRRINNLSNEEIDLYVMHQANKYMLEAIRKKSKIDSNKFYYALEQYGNTVSATIPIALNNAYADKSIKPGNKVLLCGFGVGLSMASCVLHY